MATAKKSASGTKAGTKKNNNTTKKSTAGKKSTAKKTAPAAEPTVNQYRLVGVGLMLVGLMLGLWFAVIALGVCLALAVV